MAMSWAHLQDTIEIESSPEAESPVKSRAGDAASSSAASSSAAVDPNAAAASPSAPAKPEAGAYSSSAAASPRLKFISKASAIALPHPDAASSASQGAADVPAARQGAAVVVPAAPQGAAFVPVPNAPLPQGPLLVQIRPKFSNHLRPKGAAAGPNAAPLRHLEGVSMVDVWIAWGGLPTRFVLRVSIFT